MYLKIVNIYHKNKVDWMLVLICKNENTRTLYAAIDVKKYGEELNTNWMDVGLDETKPNDVATQMEAK